MIHSFKQSLAWSDSFADAPWWETVYRQAFPDFEAMVNIRADGWAQRGGIDRLIVLGGSRVIPVDEKVRERDWGDFCLELWSNEERQIPGWLMKSQACEYIAYAFVETRRCFLLPFLSLQRAYHENGDEWVTKAAFEEDGYRTVRAQNDRYTTLSIAVPIKDVIAAMANATLVRW